jgi:hypothetical protein
MINKPTPPRKPSRSATSETLTLKSEWYSNSEASVLERWCKHTLGKSHEECDVAEVLYALIQEGAIQRQKWHRPPSYGRRPYSYYATPTSIDKREKFWIKFKIDDPDKLKTEQEYKASLAQYKKDWARYEKDLESYNEEQNVLHLKEQKRILENSLKKINEKLGS